VTGLSVAVVIPTIPGRERLLDRAIASVERQFRAPDQMVIEYDGERTGAAAARNRALAKVKTDVVAFLDDDDELRRNHLSACMHVLEREPDVDLVYPRPVMVGGQDPTAVTVGGVWVKPWGVRFGSEQERHLRTRGSFIPITFLVRAAAIRRAGGFPDGVMLPDGRYRGEDEAALIAMLDAGARFRHLDVPTWLWHVHGAHTAGKGRFPDSR
jgi:hypothetical protein